MMFWRSLLSLSSGKSKSTTLKMGSKLLQNSITNDQHMWSHPATFNLQGMFF